MRFDYLTDDSEKTLAPFFSPIMLSYTLTYLSALAILLGMLWPYRPVFSYLSHNQIPVSFWGIFSTAMLIISFISLRSGRGEVHPTDYFSKMKRDTVVTHEEENNFLSYGLSAFVLHTVFLIALAMPVLIFSTIISWSPIPVFLKALILLFVSALLCRCFSFSIYLLLGKWSYIGYMLTRLFYISLFFLTAAVAPSYNPVMILWTFNTSIVKPPHALISAYSAYLTATLAGITLLILVNQILIKRRIRKEITP